MRRKRPAVLAPPIRAPITTSRPPRLAIRIVVRRVAPQVDCLVVVIELVAPQSWVGWPIIRRERGISYRGYPSKRPGEAPSQRGDFSLTYRENSPRSRLRP